MVSFLSSGIHRILIIGLTAIYNGVAWWLDVSRHRIVAYFLSNFTGRHAVLCFYPNRV